MVCAPNGCRNNGLSDCEHVTSKLWPLLLGICATLAMWKDDATTPQRPNVAKASNRTCEGSAVPHDSKGNKTSGHETASLAGRAVFANKRPKRGPGSSVRL